MSAADPPQLLTNAPAAPSVAAQMQTVLDLAVDGIITIDHRGTIASFNRAAQGIFGYDAQEVIGRNVNVLMPSPDHERHDEYLRHYLETGQKKIIGIGREVTGRRKDGSTFPMDLAVSEIPLGGCRMFMGTVRDITARKQAELELRQSRAELQTVVENLIEGVVVSDLDGNLLHWNRAALVMHGFASLDECRRRLPEFTRIFELATLDGKVLPLEQWPLSRILGGEELRDQEIRIRRLGSDWQRVFNYGGTLVHDPDGRHLLAIVTINDITQRKAAEAEIRLLAQFPEENPNPVIRALGDGRLAYLNRPARQMLTALGWNPDDPLPAPLLPTVQQVLREGGEHEAEIACPPDRVYSFLLSPSLTDGHVNCYGRDITDRKRADEALRTANIELQRRNQETQEFLAILAHDLKHPVIGIQGLLGIMKKDIGASLDPDSRQNLDLVLGECDRMREMLRQLSLLGRIAGIELRPERVNLARLIGVCLDRFRAPIASQGVQVTVDCPEVEIICARAQVEEALNNLLDNALKYGCPKGDGQIAVEGRVNDRHCQIAVIDHGAGIDPRFHRRVFEPFRRLGGQPGVGGSGLGLTGVRKLMQRMGGDVELQSEPGKHTRFTVSFALGSSDQGKLQITSTPSQANPK